MKILMLSWEYPPRTVGGLARHVEGLSRALGEKGAEIAVVTAGDGIPPEPHLRDGVLLYPAPNYPLPSLGFVSEIQHLNFSFIEQAISLINSWGSVDLIHAHDWLTAYAARALKHIYRVPLISTIHATEYGRNCGLHNDLQNYISSIEWWLTYEAWKVIVCSGAMKNEVRSIFQLPEDKVKVIPNGIVPEEFTFNSANCFPRDKYALPEEKILFFIGRLVPEKGVQTLLEAAPQILAREPRGKIVIAGTGPYEEELKRLTFTLGLGEKVSFLGYVRDEERNALFSYADLAVFPSLYEPFGIVALEGMAAGVPVVVADTGGLGEIIRHGINGLKFVPGNSDSLSQQVIRVLSDSSLGKTMVQKAREEAIGSYSWAGIAETTLELYRTIIAQSQVGEDWLPVWASGEENHRKTVRRYDL
jgi:glycogen(starch) synthase